MPIHHRSTAAPGHIPHYGAFESTKVHGYGTDILETTRHLEKWREDLDLLREAGLCDLRYSAPWHRIERRPGQFDFKWLDGPMCYMRQTGMRPVIDLLHHTSFPDWLEDGFANPDFPAVYGRFVRTFIERYEWADAITIFNEPLATTLMCSVIGAWYPYRTTDRDFVRMAANVARAICEAEKILRNYQPEYRSFYIDTCEHHYALDEKSRNWTCFANRRRFLFLDLVLGRISAEHPLWDWLVENGFDANSASWFRDNPIRIDMLGLDYYPHSEIDWRYDSWLRRPNIPGPVESPRGLASVAMEYVQRYALPVAITETNVRGTVFDRLTWLRFTEEEAAKLARRTPVHGFCWYPSIDSTDWCHVCAKSTASVDPQGIWYLDDERRIRHSSELSHWYSRLAKGDASFSDLPAWRFRAPLDTQLAGYIKLMSHWDSWKDDEMVEEAA